jgi:hypothetical protein
LLVVTGVTESIETAIAGPIDPGPVYRTSLGPFTSTGAASGSTPRRRATS